jgi:hypothetical protein
VVVSTPEPARVLAAAERRGVPAARIGTVRVGSDRLRFTIGDRTILASLRRLGEAFHNTIPAIMGASPAEVAVLEQHPSVATV